MKTHLLLVGAALVLAALVHAPAAEAKVGGITIYRPTCPNGLSADWNARANAPTAAVSPPRTLPPGSIWVLPTRRFSSPELFVAVIGQDRTVRVYCGSQLPASRDAGRY